MGPMQKNWKRAIATMTLAAGLTGCANSVPSFSLLAEENNFSQIPTVTQTKIDVLWVVDNSGSMSSSQANVADNFQSFIKKFNEKKMDYRMAVITTESYRSLFGAGAAMAKFRDGNDQNGHTGQFVVSPTTPNLEQTFLTNMVQGINGSGDERAFQSIKESLTNPINAEFGFPRKDAFLAVIIVSDEDDFSHDGSESRSTQYTYPGMHTVDSYVSWLDALTLSTPQDRKYNVSSIAILDQTCLDTLNATSPGRKIGLRYQELTSKTKGIIGSLCGDFAGTLADISSNIIELSTRFPLNREPNPSTIVVHIDGKHIANDEINGWTYDATSNSISFHGDAVPAVGAQISIRFDPVSIK